MKSTHSHNPVALGMFAIAIFMAGSQQTATASEGAAGQMKRGSSEASASNANLLLRSAPGGVLVSDARGAAGKLGVATGDTIAAIDGYQVRTPDDLMGVLRTSPSDSHTLSVARGGEKRAIRISTAAWRPFLTPKPPEPSMAGAEPPVPPTPPPAAH